VTFHQYPENNITEQRTIKVKMSSSNPPPNNFEEETTKDENHENAGLAPGQGRKLTPLPISNPGAKPGQNQAAVHKLSTTLEEEDELENDLNENRNQQQALSNLPKNSISSASSTNSSIGSAQNQNENGKT